MIDFDNLQGKYCENEPLARYTSWGIGGPAERFFQPTDLDDFFLFMSQVPADEPLFYLGLGSNTLIRDGGIRGTVINTIPGLSSISQTGDDTVRVESGVACPKFARFCAKRGLKGLECLATVPGTMGGALALNAGAYGQETWDFVQSLEMVNREGKLIRRDIKEFAVNYRQVKSPENEWFVAAHFKLPLGESEDSLAKIRKFLEHRASTQPTSDSSCGSVFRNPEGDYAGRLIEACGLKGHKIGGAKISEKHANFFINDDKASAKDLETLINFVSEKVFETHGIKLIQEVHIVGEAND